jgi:hypothetical protein
LSLKIASAHGKKPKTNKAQEARLNAAICAWPMLMHVSNGAYDW